jgi:hypothetical protein
MKVKSLSPNTENPRVITDQRLKRLKKNLALFGDLSGLVFNTKTKRLVTYHQRVKLLENADIAITKKYSRPSKTGTVAEGWFTSNGERFSYREVYWDDKTEKAATIAANKTAGDWDVQSLANWMKELKDADFDLESTMFELEEIEALPIPITVGEHTRKAKQEPSDEPDEETKEPPKCKREQIYRLGDISIKCGGDEDDLRFCDAIISKWEKWSGLKAELKSTEVVRKGPAKQGDSKVGHA